MPALPKRYVYVLASLANPARHYVGVTAQVSERVAAHNAGLSAHTARHRPWQVLAVVELRDEHGARRFEKYLKSGSGRAFAKRHFV